MSNENKQADSSDQLSPDYYNDFASDCCNEQMMDGSCSLCRKKCNPVDSDGNDVIDTPASDYGLKNRVIDWADNQDLSIYHVQAFSTNKMAGDCLKALGINEFEIVLYAEIWNLCFTLLETDLFGAE